MCCFGPEEEVWIIRTGICSLDQLQCEGVRRSELALLGKSCFLHIFYNVDTRINIKL